jgi:hypothetical protein
MSFWMEAFGDDDFCSGDIKEELSFRITADGQIVSGFPMESCEGGLEDLRW